MFFLSFFFSTLGATMVSSFESVLYMVPTLVLCSDGQG